MNVHSLQVFDFSTLYTNLDQSAIKENVFAFLISLLIQLTANIYVLDMISRSSLNVSIKDTFVLI